MLFISDLHILVARTGISVLFLQTYSTATADVIFPQATGILF